ncbi:hypothetical protein [Pseudoxanthomonas daejeonensis]|uniref:Uncharacterized protein n=1 Tax=Pseudoxanthomonas daejeonensis TaxID=266062 RepID=A0ABQ6Z753_9GAMM|nr:hypothetical protein [Pseudoxanthomonas daejeonensis]KAF1694714.1 hypothetical protein CSC65_08440 [Pseudoxanthomonas daejeonensis]
MNMPTGPSLDTLLRRLLDTPPDFLDPPWRGGAGQLHVAAVVNDVFVARGLRPAPSLLATLSGNLSGVDSNQMTLAAVIAWMMADESWDSFKTEADTWTALFVEAAPALAASAPADRFVFDPERREELARIVVARLGLLPDGETQAQAADRLARVSGVERRRLLEASRTAEARARAIREALAKKAAEESADKWTRE